MNTRAAIAAALVLAMPSTARAETARGFVEAHGGFGTYAMTDVNDELAAVNAVIAPFSLSDINSGAGYGLGFGVALPRGGEFGIAYDRLTGSSRVGDATGSIEYAVPANVFRLTGARTFPGNGKVHGRLGASFGLVSEVGTVRISAVGSGSASGDLRGTSPMFELFGGLDAELGPQADLLLDAGYRRAKAGGIEVNGTPITNASGQDYAVDFSGVMFRLGLRMSLAR